MKTTTTTVAGLAFVAIIALAAIPFTASYSGTKLALDQARIGATAPAPVKPQLFLTEDNQGNGGAN
jgi:hypothetical protein